MLTFLTGDKDFLEADLFDPRIISPAGLRGIISLKHSAEEMRLPLKARHRISRAAVSGFLRKQTAGIGSCIL